MPIVQQTYSNDDTNEIVGKIPPWIIRRGNLVIFITFVGMLIMSCFVTYQDKISTTAMVCYTDNKFTATALIPSNSFGKINLGQEVIIKLDCYPEAEFGHLAGTISEVNTYLQDGSYPIKISIQGTTTNYGNSIKPIAEMTAHIEVIVASHPLILKIINPLKQMVKR